MRKKHYIKTVFGACLALFWCAGCAVQTDYEPPVPKDESTQAQSTPIDKAEPGDINDLLLRDNPLLYADDEESNVITMYLTVRRGNQADGTDHSWQEVNTHSAYYYDRLNINRYQVEAILQAGDENGPLPGEVGFNAVVPNATVQIRGQTSSRSAQKNYKVRLKDNKGLWNGQQTINLNKHKSDGLRFRNKLGFDLIKGIPQMVSLQTQFVHLYVKDETGGTPGAFEDYGLYTQVEQLNKKGLRTHGLDPDAHLYKVNYCEFYRYEDDIRMMEDPGYNEKQFEARLECKGNQDHKKLINMLEDVNDYSIPVSDLIQKHFNIENLTYWMAFHILTGNVDTQNRNFYIYSPQNSQTWYIISWDCDAMLRKEENKLSGRQDAGGWNSGISNYWGNILFRRCLKSESFRAELDRTIQELRGYLTKDRIDGLVSTYRPVVEPYINRLPDQYYAPLTPEKYDFVANTLSAEIETNYNLYTESLEKPLPFYIGVPRTDKDKLKTNWDISYDFQSEDILYKAEISTDYRMQNVVASYEGLLPEMECDLLPPGQYFIRVQSKDTSGNKQYAFDYYVTESGKEYGIKCFYVLPDGTIGEDVYEE